MVMKVRCKDQGKGEGKTYSHNELALAIPLHRKDIKRNHHHQRKRHPSSRIRLLIPITNHRHHSTQLRAQQHRRRIKVRPSERKTKRFIHISFAKLKNAPSNRQVRSHLPNSEVTGPNERYAITQIAKHQRKRAGSSEHAADTDEEAGPDTAPKSHELHMTAREAALGLAEDGVDDQVRGSIACVDGRRGGCFDG